MMLNGNLRFESDATFKRVCAAMEVTCPGTARRATAKKGRYALL